ncbi:MAG: hypothetical protein JNL50_07685 [Phycisphaerae bacterium]|nr:hypothetical protein [Phycisphaerae bacterium]
MPAAFTLEAWLFLGALIILGPLCLLYTLAVHQTNNQAVHDLKLRVGQLKSDYSRRVREAREAANALYEETGEAEVDIVEDQPGERKAA